MKGLVDMREQMFSMIKTSLASTVPGELRQGLELVRKEIPGLTPSEKKSLVEPLTALFYIDLLDEPDLMPLLDEAISIVAQLGKSVIPTLIEKLDAGDLKAQIAFAHALGRIGAEAIRPLIAEYSSSTDVGRRSFILYALGKIKSPEIVHAVPVAVEAIQSPSLELRDTAARALGKFAESIPSSRFPEETRRICIERLQKNLADTNPGIRSKAVRSLGKFAKWDHLTIDDRAKLKATCLLILGKDEQFEWDRAFVVRKEAEEALQYL